MAIKVGINGFGRIGRNILRTALTNSGLDFVAVNDLTSPKTLAHLLKYDSILGNLLNEISATDDAISVDGKKVQGLRGKDPAKLDWDSVGAQVVIESTGHFTEAISEGAPARTGQEGHHLRAGTNEDITIVYGVNDNKYDPKTHHVISNASLHHELPGARRQGGHGQLRVS